MEATVPTTTPQLIAEETFLIPNLAPAEPGAYVPVSSLLIRGEEPVIVDTSAPIFRERWKEAVFSLVDPADVKWIFLSHDDGDHTGALHEVLVACPSATLVSSFFAALTTAPPTKWTNCPATSTTRPSGCSTA